MEEEMQELESENKNNAENREIEAATPVDQSLQTAVTQIPDVWGGNNAKVNLNTVKAQQMASTKHGMYAGVPMICKGLDCPYRETCWIAAADLVTGERCPIEIGTVMSLYEGYVEHFGIGDGDRVDQGLLKQLIDIEVMMVRADKKMASSPDLVRDVVDAINQRSGDVYQRKDIDPIMTLKSDLRKEHHRILSLLQGTRKDKKDTLLRGQDPSSTAAALLQKFNQMRQNRVIEAELVTEQPVETQEEVKEDGSSSERSSS